MLKIKDLLQKEEKHQAEIHVLRAMLRHPVMQEQDRRLVRIFFQPNPTLLLSMRVHPNLLFNIQVV